MNQIATSMTNAERIDSISKKIADLRPMIEKDGGSIDFVKFDGFRVMVRLGGCCLSCALAMQTLGGIRREIMQVIDIPIIVVPYED